MVDVSGLTREYSVSVSILFRSLCAPKVRGELVSLKRMGVFLSIPFLLFVCALLSALASKVSRDGDWKYCARSVDNNNNNNKSIN